MKKDNRKVFFIMVLIIGLVIMGQGKKEAFLNESLSFLQDKCADVISLYPNATIWERTTDVAGCTLYCLDSSSGTCEEVSPECNYDVLVQSCSGGGGCTDGRVCTDSTHYQVCASGQWGEVLECPSSTPRCQNGICVQEVTSHIRITNFDYTPKTGLTHGSSVTATVTIYNNGSAITATSKHPFLTVGFYPTRYDWDWLTEGQKYGTGTAVSVCTTQTETFGKDYKILTMDKDSSYTISLNMNLPWSTTLLKDGRSAYDNILTPHAELYNSSSETACEPEYPMLDRAYKDNIMMDFCDNDGNCEPDRNENPSNCGNDCPCLPDCDSGETRCNGQYKQTCGNYDDDSCLDWPLSTSGSGNTYCTNGCADKQCSNVPIYQCIGTIPSNSQLCSGDDIGLTANTSYTPVASCGTPQCESLCNNGYQPYGDSCQLSTQTCSQQGETCFDDQCNLHPGYVSSSGICDTGYCCILNGACIDGCSSEQTKCLNINTKQTCGNYDDDSCLEWGGDINCPNGCSNNQCNGTTGLEAVSKTAYVVDDKRITAKFGFKNSGSTNATFLLEAQAIFQSDKKTGAFNPGVCSATCPYNVHKTITIPAGTSSTDYIEIDLPISGDMPNGEYFVQAQTLTKCMKDGGVLISPFSDYVILAENLKVTAGKSPVSDLCPDIYCGDGSCDSTEDSVGSSGFTSCPNDCGNCNNVCEAWTNSTYQCGTRTCTGGKNCPTTKQCETGTTDSWMKYLWIFFGFMGFMMFMKMMSRMNK